jgi:hypothetical protein
VAQLLEVFAELRFSHNDLHLANILAQPLVQDYEGWSWFVRVLDLGRASLDPSVGLANAFVRAENWPCARFGECQTFVPKLDLYCFFASYLLSLGDQPSRALEQVLPAQVRRHIREHRAAYLPLSQHAILQQMPEPREIRAQCRARRNDELLRFNAQLS